MKKNIIIIGAGPAGLTAAYELTKYPQYQVTVLEADAVAGGISRTVLTNGNRMDLGGHRFFSKDQRVMDWWFSIFAAQGKPSLDDRLLNRKSPVVTGGPDPQTQDDVFLIRKRISRIYYKHNFFDYPLSLSAKTLYNLGFFTLMQAGFSYLAAQLHKLPETSLENFYINRFGRKLYSMFFEGYTEKLWGRHPSAISADWGAQRVKGLSILAVLKDLAQRVLHTKPAKKETSLIEEFYYPKYGPGQLWTSVSQRIIQQGGQVLFNSPVTGLVQQGNKLTAVICNGKEIPADIVISSMPLKDLVAGLPQTPDPIRHVAQHLPYRDFVTVGLLVDKLALPNNTKIPTFQNTVPDCWIYVQDVGVKMGRIQIFNNWSPYMVKDVQHTVWVGLEYFCNEGDDFWNMSDEDCIQQATQELQKIGIISAGTRILGTHRERVKKAYPAYFDTYGEIDTLIGYLNSIENLYCIGRNGQHRYNNMDHSMVTAFETVHAIVHQSADKTPIWNVNTEKEYHESK